MTFKRFKELFQILQEQPIFNDIPASELAEYDELKSSNQKYNEWVLKQYLRKAGVRVPKQCCLKMQYHLIEYYREKKELKENPEYINYDSVIVYIKHQKDYGIPIHDGGSSYIQITFCPWCGTKLSDP